MPILMALRAALAWLGRQGTRAFAVSVFFGLALPQLAAYVKPYLGHTVFVLLLFSYLRTDPAAFIRYVRAPKLTIVAALWVMVAVPLLFGIAYTAAGLRESMPALYTILILQIATTPITSSAAFAALMGLDVAFSLVTLIITNAMSPVTTVAFSYLFLGSSLFSPIELGVKLFLFFCALRHHRLRHPPRCRQGMAGASERAARRPQRPCRLHLRHRRHGKRAAQRDR